MIRSVMSMFSGKHPASGVSSASQSTPAPQLLSKKRKSSEAPAPVHHEDDQTMEYGAMLKPKLLSTSLLHHAPVNESASHDSENSSLLSNTLRTSSTSALTVLKSTNTITNATLMKKLSAHAHNAAPHVAAAPVAPMLAIFTSPTSTANRPAKEDSPPKRQKLNSGGALPLTVADNAAASISAAAASAAAAPAAPLPPMPASVAHMLSVFELELESRLDRLRTTSAFQISQLTRSFKNELNRVPTKVRGLTLAQFLDVRRFEGDAALVMNENAMASQNRLESWVAATPKLRTSRKHREMMMATPSHSALLATTQRLTRASARKLNPTSVTGLGVGIGEATSEAAPVAVAPRMPTINLSDAVYETPSARGRIRPRVEKEKPAAAATASSTSMSIASLIASAAKSAKKKKASSSSTRSISPDAAMEVDPDTSASTDADPAEAEPAATTRGKRAAAAKPKATTKAAPKPRATRAKKASVSLDEPDLVSTEEAPAKTKAAPKKRVGRPTKKSAAASDAEDGSMEEIILVDAPKEEAPAKRVTRARAKKGDSDSSAMSKMLAEVNAVVDKF